MQFSKLNILILAAIGIGGRYVIHSFCEDEDLARKLTVFWHLFFVMLAVLAGVISQRNSGFAASVKVGVQNAGKYSLALGIFLFVLYHWIDTGYFPQRIAELIANSGITDEAEIARAKESYTAFFTPSMYSVLTTMGLLLMGTFYAILSTLVVQKFPALFKKIR